MLFVVIDRPTATLETVWFEPSLEFDRLAITMGRGDRHLSASTKPNSNDKWSPYRVGFPDLPPAILGAVRERMA